MNHEAKFDCVLVYSRIIGSLVRVTLNRSRSGRHLFFTLFFFIQKTLSTFLFLIFIYLFLYSCAGSSLLCGLFFCCGACASHCSGCLVVEHRFWGVQASVLGAWAQWLRLLTAQASAQQLWCTGLVAPGHVRSSWVRD